MYGIDTKSMYSSIGAEFIIVVRVKACGLPSSMRKLIFDMAL